jgi:hypothetical protein
MLKFSGYPYLIRGQTIKWGVEGPRDAPTTSLAAEIWEAPGDAEKSYYAEAFAGHRPLIFEPTRKKFRRELNTKPGLISVMTLEQAYPSEYQRAQCAFKDSMILEFCNSHYLSHFAAFFIDARTKRSVVESFDYFCVDSDVTDDQSWRVL